MKPNQSAYSSKRIHMNQQLTADDYKASEILDEVQNEMFERNLREAGGNFLTELEEQGELD